MVVGIFAFLVFLLIADFQDRLAEAVALVDFCEGGTNLIERIDGVDGGFEGMILVEQLADF